MDGSMGGVRAWRPRSMINEGGQKGGDRARAISMINGGGVETHGGGGFKMSPTLGVRVMLGRGTVGARGARILSLVIIIFRRAACRVAAAATVVSPPPPRRSVYGAALLHNPRGPSVLWRRVEAHP